MMWSIRQRFTVRHEKSSGAIISTDGDQAGSKPNCGTKTACKQARRAQILSAARRIAELEGWSNVTVSAAIPRNFIQPTRLVRSFWKPRRSSRRGCYRGFPGDRPGFGEGTETGQAR